MSRVKLVSPLKHTHSVWRVTGAVGSCAWSLQFPEQIVTLKPVTQLYVSIDAATRDSLKAVDRPLFPDFWERYLGT